MAQQQRKCRPEIAVFAICVTVFLCFSAAFAEDAAQPATDAAAPPAAENAQLRTELEQLKQLVLQQQARINALEHQQVSGAPAPAGGELVDMLSSLGVSPAVDPMPTPQAVPQTATLQAPQNAGSSDERIRNLERRLKGLGPLSISGDIRVREERWFGGPQDGSLDRARARIRARINFLADLGPQFQTGLALASGDVFDPISTNNTLGVFYTRKPIAIDQAFVSYKPKEFKPLTLTAGKFRYPWYNTELTWDKDLNPEGAAETLAFPLENLPVLKRIAVVGFQLPFAETTPYATSKGAVLQLSRTLALEWAPYNVTVNCILPGPFATEMNQALLKDPKVYQEFIAKVPLGRWGNLDEIGGLVVFLASDASSFITGAAIAIDGGWTAH